MARRVNKKFLVIFGGVLVLGVGAALFAAIQIKGAMRTDRNKKMVETADRLVKEAETEESSITKKEKYENAVRNYLAAQGSDPKNPELCLKLGDAFTKLTQYDVNTYIRESRRWWDRALENDPAYVPALKRLMESYYQEVQLYPVAGFFAQVEEKATTIHKLQPDDRKAHSLMYIAPIHQWLANIETPPQKLDVAMQELAAMIDKNPADPENTELVFWLSGALAKRGIEAKRGGQDKPANDFFAASVQTFNDALKAQDGNAYLHFHFFEVLSVIRSEDRERDKTQRYSEQMVREMERARQLARPEDPNFVKIIVAAHEWALSRQDKVKAEQILLDAVSVKPKDQRLRLVLARLWRYDKEKRAAAIVQLQLPIQESGGFEGVEARRRIGLEIDTLVDLTSMLIDDYANSAKDTAAAARENSLKEIKAYYARAEDRLRAAQIGEVSALLKLRGKIELLEGGVDAQVKAIKSFERAQKQYQIEHNGKEEMDLTFLLARSYMAAGMTGQAKQQLQKFMERNKDFIPARMMLAQILVREGDVVQAKTHVDYLVQQAPEEPDVVRLAIAVMDPVKERVKIQQYVGKLPEHTRAEQMLKAATASSPPSNNNDEALRLYKQVLEKDPADFEPLQAAKEILVSQNKKEEALALLKAGKAAKADKKIDLLIEQLDGASVEKMIGSGEALIRELNKDKPLEMELKLYEFKLMAGKVNAKTPEEIKAAGAAAFKHLEEAEKIKPDDTKVMDLMFQHYLAEKDWDKAGAYVEKLTAINADQVKGLIYRYRLAIVRGDIKAATSYARDMTKDFGEFARSWVFLGQSLQAAGLFDDAVANYTMALDRQSENPDALVGLISCLYQLNRMTDAYKYIEQGVKSFPNNAFFREQMKAWQMNWGDPALVLDQALAERDAKPDDVQKWIQLGRVQGAAARKRDANAGKYIADAKVTFTEAAKRWPGERLIWAFLVDIADQTRDYAYGESVLKQMAARPEFKDSPDPAMMLADFYLRFSKAEQAEATLKQAVATFTDNTEVRRRLAAYYTQLKKFKEALELLDPASKDKLVRQQIVEVLMLSGEFGRAEQMLNGLLTGDGAKDAQLHSLMGVVMLNQGRKERALSELNAALALDPKNQAALYSRGQIRLKDSPVQLDEALRDLMALRDANINHIEGRVSLAEALRQKGQTDAAERELEDVLKRVPARRDVRVSLAGMYAGMKPPQWNDVDRLLKQAEELEPNEAMWKRMTAKMLSARNQHDAAALKVREAMSVAKTDVERGDLVRDYMDILENGRNWAQLQMEVDQLFKTAPQTAKDGWWAYVKRAVAKKNLGDKAEAMKDFEQAFMIAQDQGNSDVLFGIVEKIGQNLGPEAAIFRVAVLAADKTPAKAIETLRWKVVLSYLYFTNNDPKNAMATVEEFTGKLDEMAPKDKATAMTVAGTVYMLTGEFDKARKMYERLLVTRPDDVAALNNMACMMAEHVTPPDLNKALDYATKARELMDKKKAQDASLMDTYGWINVLIGGDKLDKGIEELDKAIKQGDLPESHYHLAEAFMKKKMVDEAKKSLERADQLLRDKIEKSPSDKNLKDLKDKIEQATLRAAAIR